MREPLSIQIGSSGNQLPGWRNFEQDQLDITAVLPFRDESVRHLFLEHVIEHVTPRVAFRFFQEALRVLEPGGVLRMAFPCVVKLQGTCTQEYADFFLRSGWGDGTRASCIEALVFEHGHASVWSRDSMCAVLNAVGFATVTNSVGESFWPELRGLERHPQLVGETINVIETVIVDALKPVFDDLPGRNPAGHGSRVNEIFGKVAVPVWEGSAGKAAVAGHLKSLGIEFEFFNAADRFSAHGAALDPAQFCEREAVLILEPHVRFQPGFAAILDSVLHSLPFEWNSLLLRSADFRIERLTSHLGQCGEGACRLSGYAIHERAAVPVCEILKSMVQPEEALLQRLKPGVFVTLPDVVG